jgi:hypothetical protein
MEMLGDNTYLSADATIGIKNGLKRLIAKNLQFVKWLFEGFLLETKVEIHSGLISNVFNTLMGMCAELFALQPSMKSNLRKGSVLPLLLKSTSSLLYY